MDDWNSILFKNDAPQVPDFRGPSLLVVQDAPILNRVTPPQLFDENLKAREWMDETEEHEPTQQ